MRRNAAAALAATGAWLVWALAVGNGAAWTAAFFFACSASAALLTRGAVERRPVACAFWLSLAAYLSTFHWRGGDDIVTALLPFAILKHGTLAVEQVMAPFLQGPDGLQFTLLYPPHRLSFYPVAGGIVAVPLYLVTVLASAPISVLFLHNLAKIGGATITAASVALFCAAARRREGARFALWLTAVYAFGTWAFSVSSQALWIHGPVQLGLALAFFGLSGGSRLDDLLAGLGLGLAVATRPDSVFLAAALTCYVLARAPRRLPLLLLGAVPWVLQLALYWVHFTGRLLPPDWGSQGQHFGALDPGSFLAMLVSPTRGLLWFCPAAVFGFWAALKRPRSLAPWLAAGALVTIAFLACYRNWLAGMTFGERYESAVGLALVFACVELGPELLQSALWRQAAAFSIIVHALGAYFRWPGSFDAGTQAAAQLWNPLFHPILNLSQADGPLFKLPLAARWLAVAAAIVLWQLLARRFGPRPAAKPAPARALETA